MDMSSVVYTFLIATAMIAVQVVVIYLLGKILSVMTDRILDDKNK